MESDALLAILIATIGAGTPLLYAALGELICEKSGVLNLGLEGIMLFGAVIGFIVAAESGSIALAMGAALAAGACLASIFGFITLILLANQVATGLALSIFGIGLSAFLGLGYTSVALDGLSPLLFGLDAMVYLSWILLAAISLFLYASRAGLVLRAVGESPSSGHALGYSVIKIRFAAVLFGGAMSGIGGAYLSVVYTPIWVEEMTAGRGWIALALVVFASWRPLRVIMGAYLFGGVTIFQFHIQGWGVELPSQLLSALPYLATITVLVLISRNSAMVRRNAPASLGKPYHPEAS